MEERIPTMRPIRLPEEDPQIHCPVCDVIDCMIHNPRHRYCMRCGQRLLGPHTCPNERDHLEPPIVQHPIPIDAIGPTEPVQRRAHFPGIPLFLPDDTDVESLRGMVLNSTHRLNMDLISRPVPPIPQPAIPHRSSIAELSMYNEAIMCDQGITAWARIPPRTQNVLCHIDYSSDPEEARIHFELMSPTRRMRSRDKYQRSPRRSRRRDSPENSGISHYHYYQGDIDVGQPPWMAGTTRMPRGLT